MIKQFISILADGRKNNGGKREGSGRPRKIDEELLHKMMDKALAPQEVWDTLAAKVQEGDVNAIKLFCSYRFGQPSNKVELSGKDGTDIIVNIIPPSDI